MQTSAYNVISQLLKQNGSPVFRIQNAKKIGKAMEHTISKLYYEQEVGDVELSCLAYQCLCILQAEDDIFTKETGISPIEYAAQTKINYAKSILKTTKTSK